MPISVAEYVPQVNQSRRPLLIWLFTSLLALTIIGLVVAAPLAAASQHPDLASTIYSPFGVLCHQLSSRSFLIAGHKLAVCSRCTGLYSGFTVALLLYPLIIQLRSTTVPPANWLFVSAVPLFVDFALTFLGIWENTHASRFITGFLLGGVTVFYVMPGLVELSLRVTRRNVSRKPTFTMSTPDRIASAPSDYSAPERRI